MIRELKRKSWLGKRAIPHQFDIDDSTFILTIIELLAQNITSVANRDHERISKERATSWFTEPIDLWFSAGEKECAYWCTNDSDVPMAKSEQPPSSHIVNRRLTDALRFVQRSSRNQERGQDFRVL